MIKSSESDKLTIDIPLKEDLSDIITDDLLQYGESYVRLFNRDGIVYRHRISPEEIIWKTRLNKQEYN